MITTEDKYNLIYTICMTSASLKDGLRKEFAKNGYDITIDNFAIMFRLWHKDNLTQQQLCELTCKNKSNLTRILDTMEKKDMIRRSPNLSDRRSFIISTTEHSRSLKLPIIKIALEYSSKIFELIDENEIRVLENVFQKINDTM